MPGQFDLQPTVPIAGIADLIASRPQKEAQMRLAQQQQLIQGIQGFGEGVSSLVQKRNQMAQALTLGKNLGMAPEEVQGLTPDQVIHAATIKKGGVDVQMLMTLLHPNATTPNAGSTVSGPAGQAPIASTGGPILASYTKETPVADANNPLPSGTTSQTPTPIQSQAPMANPSMPVPIPAPPVKPMNVNPATMKAALAISAQQRPEQVLQYVPGEGLVKVGTKHKGDQVITSQPRLDVGMKEEQFYQREWDKLLKESDPLNASSRTPLGLASRANFQANRALKTLSNPVVTNQEAGNAMADVAAIYQNGSPTQFGMSQQEYQTLYGKVQGIIQGISGKPQDALPDAIKNRLVGVLSDMKHTNQALLKQRLDLTEHSKKSVISHFPQEWKEYREVLEGDQSNYNGLAPQAPAQGGSAWTPDNEKRLQMLLEKQKNGTI